MTYMPDWYRIARSAISLLQSVVGLLLVSYPLKKRKGFPLQLILATGAGCLVLCLFGSRIYIPGSSPAAIASHALTAAIVYVLLIAVAFASYDENIWTILFSAATGYIAQDVAGSVKTLLRQIESIALLAQRSLGIVAVDIICYGAVYAVIFFALRPFIKNRNDNFD